MLYLRTKQGVFYPLCELLLLEHMMLLVSYLLSAIKHTLVLWCWRTAAAFRLRFMWFAPFKYVCLGLGFAVMLDTDP